MTNKDNMPDEDYEISQEIIDRHNAIVKANPDLHQGKAVPFDGRLDTGHETYPEFNLHNATNILRYTPIDEKEEIIMDASGILDKFDDTLDDIY